MKKLVSRRVRETRFEWRSTQYLVDEVTRGDRGDEFEIEHLSPSDIANMHHEAATVDLDSKSAHA